MLGLVGSIATAATLGFVSPVLAAVQLPAAFVLLDTPSHVPAYSVAGFDGSIARARTLEHVKPVPAGAQLPPPSVDLYTP